jgi:hypothetical protein
MRNTMHPRQLRQLQSVIVSMPFAHLNRTLCHVSAQSNVLTGLTDFFGICEQALSARENTVLGEIEPSTASELTFHETLFADSDVFRAK